MPLEVLQGFFGGEGEGVVLQNLFNKDTVLRACGFVEGRIQHGCCSCVICEIFESSFFDEHLATTAILIYY